MTEQKARSVWPAFVVFAVFCIALGLAAAWAPDAWFGPILIVGAVGGGLFGRWLANA